MAAKSPGAAGGGAAGSGLKNGQMPIKQEVTSQNPPPLHPTSGGSMPQRQQATGGGQTPIPIVASLDPNRIMPVNITLPSTAGSGSSESRVLTIQVPASALQENQLTQILTAHLISSIMTLPTTLASSVLQQHVNAALTSANIQSRSTHISLLVASANPVMNLPENMGASKQLDGALDSSDEDESEESDDNIDNDDDDDLDKDDDDDVEQEDAAEEEPLNSEDDVTDEDSTETFDTDNVIVCQYDKVLEWQIYLDFYTYLLYKFFALLVDHSFPQQMEILSQRWHYEHAWQGLRVPEIQR
ncbi:blast:Transcription initiation factor IIA subunit 1 [Drosophila guanche]|uniref:Blast:Transcription initiation factor IIA subunit 1 n=1 Tax=Drosophila guanche TaxID=7266 RepID=A0A3B0JF81_DROGU|nr:blast:Transcription initiation factor IIA subunit 1 [Drosophila guanche]